MRFERFLLGAALLAGAHVAGAQSSTRGVTGYVTLASGYWKHGLSQNDGPTLQLGVDYEHPTGLFVGGSATNVEFEREYSAYQPRSVEASAYLGYHRRYEQWSWTASLGAYAYPGTAIDYDYRALNGSVGFRDRVFYTVSYSDSYYARDRSAVDQEVSFAWPLRGQVEIGGGVGRFSLAGTGLDIAYWNLGASKLVGRVAFDLRYYDGDYDYLSYFGDPDANRYVLSVSYALRRNRRNALR